MRQLAREARRPWGRAGPGLAWAHLGCEHEQASAGVGTALLARARVAAGRGVQQGGHCFMCVWEGVDTHTPPHLYRPAPPPRTPSPQYRPSRPAATHTVPPTPLLPVPPPPTCTATLPSSAPPLGSLCPCRGGAGRTEEHEVGARLHPFVGAGGDGVGWGGVWDRREAPCCPAPRQLSQSGAKSEALGGAAQPRSGSAVPAGLQACTLVGGPCMRPCQPAAACCSMHMQAALGLLNPTLYPCIGLTALPVRHARAGGVELAAMLAAVVVQPGLDLQTRKQRHGKVAQAPSQAPRRRSPTRPPPKTDPSTPALGQPRTMRNQLLFQTVFLFPSLCPPPHLAQQVGLAGGHIQVEQQVEVVLHDLCRQYRQGGTQRQSNRAVRAGTRSGSQKRPP